MSTSKKKSLAKQHQGGIANKKGNEFEDHFAVWRCLEALREFEQRSEERLLAAQLKSAFVDDWVEKHGIDQHHYQLKRKPGLSWAEVAPDFREQLKSAASATLVVHTRKAETRLRRSPARVAGARVQHFPGSVHPKEVMQSLLLR